MRHARWLIAAGTLLLLTTVLYAQQTGIPSRLRGKTDANNYLLTSSVAYTGPDSALQNFSNLRLRTDANGYLLTTTGTGGSTFSGPVLFAAKHESMFETLVLAHLLHAPRVVMKLRGPVGRSRRCDENSLPTVVCANALCRLRQISGTTSTPALLITRDAERARQKCTLDSP